jgi:hypothetical protein
MGPQNGRGGDGHKVEKGRATDLSDASMSVPSQSSDDDGDWRAMAVETVADRLHSRIDSFASEKSAPDELVEKGHDLVDELAATMQELAGDQESTR